MADDNKRCKHPGCNCPTTDDEDYCSTYCHDAGDTTEIRCGCEHAGC
ncbi:MAG TPA: hypothetical protein VGB17_05935 [Pyrinomonadaceae bacterium]